MVFWKKHKRKYDIWITKEKYEFYKAQHRAYNKKYTEQAGFLENKRILNKIYYQKNIDKERERARSKYTNISPEKKEKIKESKREWHKKNKEKKMASKHKRRELEKSTSPHTKNQIAIIATLYKQSKRLQETLGIKFHVDHIVPLFMGGKHMPSNLQVIPATINLRKSYSKIFRWSEIN